MKEVKEDSNLLRGQHPLRHLVETRAVERRERTRMETDRQEDRNSSLGIIRRFGDLPPDTILSEEALAKLFNRHRVSIKRAVSRGELPPSVRLFGEPVWTVQALRDHMNRRLQAAKNEAEQLAKRISQNSA